MSATEVPGGEGTSSGDITPPPPQRAKSGLRARGTLRGTGWRGQERAAVGMGLTTVGGKVKTSGQDWGGAGTAWNSLSPGDRGRGEKGYRPLAGWVSGPWVGEDRLKSAGPGGSRRRLDGGENCCLVLHVCVVMLTSGMEVMLLTSGMAVMLVVQVGVIVLTLGVDVVLLTLGMKVMLVKAEL